MTKQCIQRTSALAPAMAVFLAVGGLAGTVVPEPASLGLLALAGVAMGRRRRV